MAEAAADDKTALTLSEQYLLKEKEEKTGVGTNPVEANEEVNPAKAAPEEVAVEKAEEISAAVSEVKTDTLVGSEESIETNSASAEDSSDTAPTSTEESKETTEEEKSGDQEASEEAPEIKLETAPADFRFPTTNQTRHCFTRYIEYHRCIAAKGEGAQECDKFAKYYRALCPGEWLERWNEQRENGTFPGPL